MKQSDVKIITISIPEDLLSWIDRTAEEELRSRSNRICQLLNYARTDCLNEDDHLYIIDHEREENL